MMSELISPAGEMPGRKKPEYSPRLEYILEDSKTEAEQFRSEEIGTEHMLTALIRDMDCVAAKNPDYVRCESSEDLSGNI